MTDIFFDKIKSLFIDSGLLVIIQALLRVYAVRHYLLQDLDVFLLFGYLIHNLHLILSGNLNCIAMFVQLNLRSLRRQITCARNTRTYVHIFYLLLPHRQLNRTLLSIRKFSSLFLRNLFQLFVSVVSLGMQ